ncbi:chemotaxis protein CheB [Pararhizobium sp. DWP1-1-3]|uniref:chemotaxis protein CheB n=1 Tax=Pararhizobium sp. DWP1-1-3 TaxID=2804652 RepID=UPI003CF48334
MKPRIGSGMISPLAAGVLLVLIAVSRTASIRRGAIGVLPSGMLNDGATGLADLKRSGGVTIVPSPLNAAESEILCRARLGKRLDCRASR